MNKKILTTALFLAVSASFVYAEDAKVPCAQKSCPKASTSAPCDLSKMDKAELKKRFEEKRAQHRQNMYKDLCFTAEQIKKAEALDIKTRKDAEPLMDKLKCEMKKYKELKASGASELEVAKQKTAVKAAKKEVKKHFDASNKAFEAILTKEQNEKFQAKRKEMKEQRKKYKSGKGHGPEFAGRSKGGDFGPPPPPVDGKMPCPCAK